MDIDVIDKQKINPHLPANIELENHIKVRKDPVILGLNNWSIAIFNKNGSRRLNDEEIQEVKTIMNRITDYEWEIDSVSNFLLHLKKIEED